MPGSSKIESRAARRKWRLLRADTQAAARRRARQDALFAKLFPEGHEHSIRNIAHSCAADQDGFIARAPWLFGHLTDLHPEASGLIGRYGIDYVPDGFDDRAYLSKNQPRTGACFRNSALVLHSFGGPQDGPRPPMVYVEGIAFGADVWPMLHAWNARLGESKSIDWTFYPSAPWIRHLGIPFTLEEHTHLCTSIEPGSNVNSFFHRERFEQFKPYLLEILEEREPYQEKPAA